MKLKKIEKTILSKNLILLFLFFFLKKKETEFFEQFRLLWLSNAGNSKNFFNFLLFQILNKKNIKTFRKKFYIFFQDCFLNDDLFDEFFLFCQFNGFFHKFYQLKNKTDINFQKDIILFLLYFNLIFYQLIIFSSSYLTKIIKKKNSSFIIFNNFLNEFPIYLNLKIDLNLLKKKNIYNKYKKNLYLNKIYIKYILKICSNYNLF
jgi:hypothetical protein